MIRRFFFTNFYEDDFITETDFYTAHTYLYLITCSYASLSGLFQLSKYKAMVESKIIFIENGEKLFDESLSKLEKAKKVFYFRNWFFVPKMAYFNSGLFKLETNRIAYAKEYQKVPGDIMGYFDEKIASNNISLYHTTIDSSIHSPIDIAMDTNKKKEKRNNNNFGKSENLLPHGSSQKKNYTLDPLCDPDFPRHPNGKPILPDGFTYEDLPKLKDGRIDFSLMTDYQALRAKVLQAQLPSSK